MHEVINNYSHLDLTLKNLETSIQKRIYTPIVKEFYEKFTMNGSQETLVEILENVPVKYHPPILHTLVTHVTKEKPIFIYGIGNRFMTDKNRVKFISASTDLLWCLSLVVDDIFDTDIQRAGKETAWYIFGKEYSYKSAEFAFKELQNLTEKKLSKDAKELLIDCVNKGTNSLKDPSIKTLDTNMNKILCNIDHRACFHCEYPIKTLFNNFGEEKNANLAIKGLFCVNRAGQILNDLKDLIPSPIYGRNLFSDIKRGISTIPLIKLYEELNNKEKKKLKSLFGNPSEVETNRNWLNMIVSQKLPRKDIYSLVLINYERFLETMGSTMDPNYFDYCQKWADYKLAQAQILLN